MRQRSKRSGRRGAAMAEAAFVLPVFLLLCLGMIDLASAVFQYNAVSHASRQGARIASVHGSLAPSGWNGGTWGTTAYPPAGNSGAGNSADTIPTTFLNAGALAGLQPSNVTIAVQWPDADNSVKNGSRVQVTVSTTWTPLMTQIYGGTPFTLTATSITPIAH